MDSLEETIDDYYEDFDYRWKDEFRAIVAKTGYTLEEMAWHMQIQPLTVLLWADGLADPPSFVKRLVRQVYDPDWEDDLKADKMPKKGPKRPPHRP